VGFFPVEKKNDLRYAHGKNYCRTKEKKQRTCNEYLFSFCCLTGLDEDIVTIFCLLEQS